MRNVVSEVFEPVNTEIVRLEGLINNLAVEHNRSNYDIWTETGRSEVEQEEFNEKLLDFYSRRSWMLWNYKVQCMVTNQWHRRDRVIASHIWKHEMHGNELHKFGLQRLDCISPRNGFLMLKSIEQRFDWKHICFVYNPLSQQFIVKVLNPAIRDVVIQFSKPERKFSDIEGLQLQHPIGKMPFRRILSFHARCAFKFAREKGWITVTEENLFMPYHDLSDSASIPDIDGV